MNKVTGVTMHALPAMGGRQVVNIACHQSCMLFLPEADLALKEAVRRTLRTMANKAKKKLANSHLTWLLRGLTAAKVQIDSRTLAALQGALACVAYAWGPQGLAALACIAHAWVPLGLAALACVAYAWGPQGLADTSCGLEELLVQSEISADQHTIDAFQAGFQ
jgi:hypothetical protein